MKKFGRYIKNYILGLQLDPEFKTKVKSLKLEKIEHFRSYWTCYGNESDDSRIFKEKLAVLSSEFLLNESYQTIM